MKTNKPKGKKTANVYRGEYHPPIVFNIDPFPTFLEEVKKRFDEDFPPAYFVGSDITANREVKSFLTSSTTEAYVLGLKRALELLPPRLSKDHYRGTGSEYNEGEHDGHNACRIETETAITEEISKHGV